MGKGKNRTGEHKIGCHYLGWFIVSTRDKANSDGDILGLTKEINLSA
jgi:hypothetical protein